MRSLVVVAHGSRREASNQEVRDLCDRLAAQTKEQFHCVNAGFLELAEPSIPEGIQHCIDAGASEVVVLPYFLSAGRHVAEDIPAEVEKARSSNPDVDIRLVPYLGAAPDIMNVMIRLAGG